MITIKRIHVKNFRSLVDKTIELSDYNFFVGKNDSGKSNVLKALNLFFNNKTDFNVNFDFENDYSKFAKRGAKQAREITISLDIIIPNSFKEKGIKTWTKTWRAEGLHTDNRDSLFKTASKGFTFLDRIQYMYIPAVKSNEYFKFLLSQVYLSMTKAANSTLKELNLTYSKQLQLLTNDLSEQLKDILRLNSAIQMPKDLNIVFRDLTFLTSDEHVKGIDLNHRGDGIKARHIPSILWYMQHNTEKNKLKNSISHSFIWGFEEPENGVEYLSCFEMADEFYSYRKECQMLITTHSPAFYMKKGYDDATCFYVYKNNEGASEYESEIPTDDINEKIGFLPLVSSYIEREQKKYLKREKRLFEELEHFKKRYSEEVDKIIIITEGKTDTKHIKTAFEQLKLNSTILHNIIYYDFNEGKTLGDELNNLLNKLSNIPRKYIVIGIFDRDKGIKTTAKGKNFAILKNNVFYFNIPALENDERKYDSKICIEHYYSNDEIKANIGKGHLYMANDFNEYGVSADNKWVFHKLKSNNSITDISIIDSSNNHLQRLKNDSQIISKDEFANYVMENPTKFNFNNFIKIFNIINEIIQYVNNNRNNNAAAN